MALYPFVNTYLGLESQNFVLLILDTWEKLHQSLKGNDCIVVRSGIKWIYSPFYHSENEGMLNYYFLFDSEVFSSFVEEYHLKFDEEQLITYKMLPTLSKNSVVDLGFASGLISEALKLDEITPTCELM